MGSAQSTPSLLNPLWILHKQTESYTVYTLPNAKEFTVSLHLDQDHSDPANALTNAYTVKLTKEMKAEQFRIRDSIPTDHVICSSRVSVPAVYKETVDPTTPVVVCLQVVQYKTATILNWRLVEDSM